MSPRGSFRRRVDSISLEEPGRSPRQACVCYLADEGVIVGKADKPQTPRKQPPFSESRRGISRGWLTPDFPCSIMTFLTDAPLAQLDRALDYESSGQRFESSRARHLFTHNIKHLLATVARWMLLREVAGAPGVQVRQVSPKDRRAD